MSVLQDSKEIYIYETERKPNRYAAIVLAAVVAVIAIACAMNEFGIFALNKLLMRICLGVSLLLIITAQVIIRNPAFIIHRASKYIIMGMVLLLVLTLTVLLNINAVLAFVLPLLLAAQYRSAGVSRMALIGACICCGVAPVLSYLLDTWNLVFMTGLVEAFCNVRIDSVSGSTASALTTIGRITLYWSLPQMLTLGAFGIILCSTTKSGIDSV